MRLIIPLMNTVFHRYTKIIVNRFMVCLLEFTTMGKLSNAPDKMVYYCRF